MPRLVCPVILIDEVLHNALLHPGNRRDGYRLRLSQSWTAWFPREYCLAAHHGTVTAAPRKCRVTSIERIRPQRDDFRKQLLAQQRPATLPAQEGTPFVRIPGPQTKTDPGDQVCGSGRFEHHGVPPRLKPLGVPPTQALLNRSVCDGSDVNRLNAHRWMRGPTRTRSIRRANRHREIRIRHATVRKVAPNGRVFPGCPGFGM